MFLIATVGQEPILQEPSQGLLDKAFIDHFESLDAFIDANRRDHYDVLISTLHHQQFDELEKVKLIKDFSPDTGVLALVDEENGDMAGRLLNAGVFTVLPREQEASEVENHVLRFIATREEINRLSPDLQFLHSLHVEFDLPADLDVLSTVPARIAAHLQVVSSRCLRYIEAFELCLGELLMNAFEHGSLGIGYDEKKNWLESGQAISELYAKFGGTSHPDRRIRLNYVLTHHDIEFMVADNGPGFDVSRLEEFRKPRSIYDSNGRGIAVVYAMMDSVKYNARGNMVRIKKVLSSSRRRELGLN